VGRAVGALILVGAVAAIAVAVWQWGNRPETDDATVRANFVGIAPKVSGHIVELPIRDNQQVKQGELLFVVDPRPYEIALERAGAVLALTRKEVDALGKAVTTADAGVTRAGAQLTASAADVIRRQSDPLAADAEIARLEAQRVASEAALRRAAAELTLAEDQLKRVEPLLPEGFVTVDRVEELRTRRVAAAMAREQARTSVDAASAALTEARVRKQAALAALDSTKAQHVASTAALAQARGDRARAEDTLGQVGNVNARVAVAEAAVHAAALDLAYCRVTAPFSGRVVNLDISVGAFARTGVDVFTLVDTGTWYVVANFRETQLRHIPPAPADIHLQSQPGGASGARWSASGGPSFPRTARA
jgi:multidrug efflux system membrane fusion protein